MKVTNQSTVSPEIWTNESAPLCYRRDTKNNGPVHWISENYVCPNCVKEPEHRCCQGVPQGLFCLPDSKGAGKTKIENRIY